jgi:hypothetical protein
MRAAWLSCLLAVGCTQRGGAAVQDGARGDEPVKRRAGEALLIGNVQRLGTKTCKSWDDEAWSDIHWRAGLVRLEGNTSGIAKLTGKPVLLVGDVATRGPPALPQESGTCPPVQSRGDWIAAPDGTILRRDAGTSVAGFRVRASHATRLLRARQSGNTLAVDLVNPLDVTIEKAAITVHYEGCFPKPIPLGERRELGRLAPGASAGAVVPAIASDKALQDQRLYRPISVQVHGSATDVYFDLDLRLSILGVEVRCPNR